MALALTATEFAILQQHVDASDRVAYYEQLSEWGYIYADLALGVVNNDTTAGKAANIFLTATGNLTDDKLAQIGLDLMKADLQARTAFTGSAQGEDLPYDRVQQYHNTVFSGNQVSVDAWTPNKALNWLSTPAARQALWDNLVNEGPIGSFLSILAALADVDEPGVGAYRLDLIDAGNSAAFSESNEFGEYEISIPGGGILIGTGTRDADLAVGTDNNDVLMSFIGNDELRGKEGDDRLYGGAGDDRLFGDEGNDILVGGTGIDILAGGAGDDILKAGKDAGYSEDGVGDYFSGGSGSNIIIAGDGDDIIESGWDGEFLPGSQNTEISPYPFALWMPFNSATVDRTGKTTIDAGGGNNIIRAYGDLLNIKADNGTNVVYAEARSVNVSLGTSINGLNVIGAVGETVILSSGFGGSVISANAGNQSLPNFGYAEINGAGGMNIITAHNFEHVRVVTGDGNDTIYVEADVGRIFIGGGENNVATAAYGNYYIAIAPDENNRTLRSTQSEPLATSSIAGNNVVNTGNGNDEIVLGGGDDYIDAGGGDDVIIAGSGNDTLLAGTGNDILEGGSGNDYLYGDQGDDLLYGGTGSDIYSYYAGHGHDLIEDWGDATSTDVLRLGEGIDTASVLVNRSSNGFWDILLEFGTSDTITISNGFLSEGTVIEQVEFSDSTIWTLSDLRQIHLDQVATDADDTIYGFLDVGDLIHANSGNDIIYGYSGNDTIYGEAGNDTIFGDEGDDIIIGGAGNDFLTGGSGSDTFVFGATDGQDWINDFEVGTDRIDVSGITGLADFAAIIATAREWVSGSTWIYADPENYVRLQGVSIASLQESDFLFA